MAERSSSLKNKIRLLLSALVILPLLATGLFSYRLMLLSIEKNGRIFTEQLGKQILLNTENYIEEVKKLTVYLFSDDLIMDFLMQNKTGEAESPLSLTNRSELSLALSSPFYYGSEVRGVYLFTNNGYVIGTNDIQSYKGETEPLFWLRYESRNHLLPYHSPQYYPGDTPVFSIVRQVNQLYTSEPIGMIKVDLLPETFEKILGQVSLTPNTSITIADSRGNLFYRYDPGRERNSRTKMILSTEESSKSDLRITTKIPLDDLDDEAAILIRTYAFLALFLLGIIITVDRLFSKIITTPVEKIKRGMGEVQEGNYGIRLEILRRDELGEISSSFNSMVGELGNSIERIKKLNREMYETRLHEKSLEMGVLQKQINPHFLYNTLELVNMIALEKDHDDISDLVTALGDLFRYSTGNDVPFVFLREEIDFISAYTRIISVRSSGKIGFSFDIPEDTNSLIIPKLSLQPLVENAVRHGLETIGGTVKIMSRRQGDELILTVEDDGVGLAGERRAGVEGMISGSTGRGNPDGGGYALHNINQRIKLQFGEPYGLGLDGSRPDEACFIIRLPLLSVFPEEEV